MSKFIMLELQDLEEDFILTEITRAIVENYSTHTVSLNEIRQ